MMERKVSLFRNGRSQALRIPREFELPGSVAVIRKEGARLILEVAPAESLLGALKGLPALPDEDRFDVIAELPLEPVDLRGDI